MRPLPEEADRVVRIDLIQCHEQGLWQVSACAEELDTLTNFLVGYTTCDTVIIA